MPPRVQPDWGGACARFREVLGQEHVVSDAAELARVSTATFPTQAQVALIVRPGTTGEVRAVLTAASRFGVHVYPTSQGKNWGLGSKVPSADGAVLLDLGRMRAINNFDDDLGLVTVEAGVTFQELYDFLAERRSRCLLNVTGTSPHASVLANAIERGDGAGPTGYRFDHVSDLEVVLPSGELLRTGFGRFENCAVAHLHRYGVGPALDGLFSQSNLGVVTRLTVWLAQMPRALAAVRFRVVDPTRLAPCVDALRTLRREGTLRSSAAMANDLRVLSTAGQYPWGLARGKRPLPRSVIDQLGEAAGGARWFGIAAVYAASDAQCTAGVNRVRELLGPVVDEIDIVSRAGEPRIGQELFTEDDPTLRYLQGIPHEESLRSLYWRKRQPPPDEVAPERDRCGVVWLCPTLPFRGSDVQAAIELAEASTLSHGFEPLLVLLAPTERVLFLVPLIIYDRDQNGDDERALACHDELLSAFIERGYLPHRLGVQSMHALPASDDSFDAVLSRIKRLLDPSNILAPGRYDFGASEP